MSAGGGASPSPCCPVVFFGSASVRAGAASATRRRFGRRPIESAASLSPGAAAVLSCAPPPEPQCSCPLRARLNGWLVLGRPWGVRPTGVGAGGTVVPRGRSGLAGSLPRVEFELGAPGLGALRLCLFSILGSYPPSRRRRAVSGSSDRLSTAVPTSRRPLGAPACVVFAGGALVSTAPARSNKTLLGKPRCWL